MNKRNPYATFKSTLNQPVIARARCRECDKAKRLGELLQRQPVRRVVQ